MPRLENASKSEHVDRVGSNAVGAHLYCHLARCPVSVWQMMSGAIVCQIRHFCASTAVVDCAAHLRGRLVVTLNVIELHSAVVLIDSLLVKSCFDPLIGMKAQPS